MSLVGADVDQLRTLARTLTQAADRLESMTSEVTSRLAATPWTGSDAEQYRSQWHGQSLAQVRTAVGALRDAATKIERNANEQEQTSAAATGTAVGTSGPIGSVSNLDAFRSTNGTEPLNPFVNARDFLNSNLAWPITWGTAIDELSGPVPVVPLLDALGIVTDPSLTTGEKWSEATNLMTDIAGDAIKDIGGPTAYLAGFAVQQWGDVVHLASQADFSASGLQTTGDYIASDPAGAFDAAATAVLDYVPKLFSNAKFW